MDEEAYHFPNDWDNVTKMSYLQRRVIVHSILYYEMSESIIDDQQFDKIGRQLVALMKSSTEEECEKTTYWYCMKDFDANTGFDLYSRLKKKDRIYLGGIAEHVLFLYKNKRECK